MEFDKFYKKYELEDFFNIRYLKNGKLSIKYRIDENQIKSLFDHLNLWYCTIKGRVICLCSANGKNKEMDIHTLREKIKETMTFFILRKLENHPELDYEQLAFARSRDSNISDAMLRRLYMYKKPEKRFEHFLRMKHDIDYRNDFTHEFFLSKFKKLRFKETTDSIGIYSKGEKLYYKDIGDTRYIVFCISYEDKKRHRYTRSFFIDYYQDETAIGQARPQKGGAIDSSEGNYVDNFKLEDYKLIAKYFKKASI